MSAAALEAGNRTKHGSHWDGGSGCGGRCSGASVSAVGGALPIGIEPVQVHLEVQANGAVLRQLVHVPQEVDALSLRELPEDVLCSCKGLVVGTLVVRNGSSVQWVV